MSTLKVLLVEDAGDGRRGYFVDEQWALERLPDLAKQLDVLVNREGTPPAKLAMRAVRLPADRDHRGGVMMILYPPVQLRDASLDQITAVLGAQAHSLISAMAREIHQSYTSDPVDLTAIRNLQTVLNREFGT
ncbi:MAG TPA: hypothetical protein VHB25_08475 [Gemmatimonadaceae bacterium]|nr:hypothetical protein [Gemmatimonadaceae bacterium]